MSGGAPKRSHEESGHSSSSKYPNEDSAAAYPKFSSSSSSAPEYHHHYHHHHHHHHHPYDDAARLPKVPRLDVDRRLSPLPLPPTTTSATSTSTSTSTTTTTSTSGIYRIPDSHLSIDNPPPPPPPPPLSVIDPKDARTDLYRDSHSQNAKPPEKDDNKDRETDTHLNWKEYHSHNHRGKKYSDGAPLATTDPWTSRSHSDLGNTEDKDKDHVEPHEAVGENKFDDKFKDKDRKRKDLKHRDWGEREKERLDRRTTMQVPNSSSDAKESAKEERDAERWERERKDPAKDKERVKERDKDHAKRDSWNGVDKDSNEKDMGNGGSNRLPDQDNLMSDKKPKEAETWKTVDKESRDRKKERDVDVDGDRDRDRDRDRPEKRSSSRGFEKESDDGAADAEGAMEREREVHNYGVQQRKRMQRSRGSPLVANREPRFRTRVSFLYMPFKLLEITGKAEVSSVIYKVGECMQELIRLWKEYEVSQTEKNGESSNSGPTLEIRIPAEHVTATNRQVRGGQLWGTDIYTDDSDLVAVLMHTGYCRPTASPPPPAIQELRATIRVLPPQDCYVSTLRNNVRSRAWGAAIGCSYRVERCCIVKKGGGTIDLEPCLTHTSTVEPTLAPVAVERTMTTRAAASNALRQQRFVREVTIQYNLCNEPWIKYSISIVADKGLKKPLYTSARLKKGEVLYLETHSCRYELCFAGEKMVRAMQSSQSHEPDSEKSQNHNSYSANGERNDSENTVIDAFRWSRCKKPLPQKVMRSVGIPLPLEYVEVVEENLDWEEVQWSQTGVWIAGKEYTLARVHFLSMN
ncbi:Histone deacetylation protein Rxt [Parasponia andersonii]|uniref:Histone deacetylation protein Rxt n=1 Tax=Parasponia andersonii TaxID=3476 RepID=A0A2P5AGC8_PARAD|nr:Histone deacetylation protein Rxt [Parasponia andersonii]